MDSLADFLSRPSSSYEELRARLEREVARVAEDRRLGLPASDPHDEFLAINLQRMRRVERTFRPVEGLARRVRALGEPQIWRVLTETWCGDSAQTVAVFAALASLSPSIDLRFLRRDENLDLMDRYLTDGKRGIPLLVAFDVRGEELFRWGPRPAKAVELFRSGVRQGLEKGPLLERLHAWYARDGGSSVAAELGVLLGHTADEAPLPMAAAAVLAPI